MRLTHSCAAPVLEEVEVEVELEVEVEVELEVEVEVNKLPLNTRLLMYVEIIIETARRVNVAQLFSEHADDMEPRSALKVRSGG